jgi:predicted RNase H-like HicB family nuclease
MAQMVVGLIHVENGNYGISFPDFPGVISAATTADGAVARGRDTLAFHVRGMVKDGDELPVPRSLEQLKKDRIFRQDAKEAMIVMVPIDLPGKSLRVNISMDENLIGAIDRAARSTGQTRSSYLAEAARAKLLKDRAA